MYILFMRQLLYLDRKAKEAFTKVGCRKLRMVIPHHLMVVTHIHPIHYYPSGKLISGKLMVPYIENTCASTLYAIVVGTLIFILNHNRFKLPCFKKKPQVSEISKLVKIEDGQEAPALRTEDGDMYITSINMHAG